MRNAASLRSPLPALARNTDGSSALVEANDVGVAIAAVTSGALAARVARFVAPKAGSKMGRRLIEHPAFGHYAKAPDIGKVGYPYYDTVGDDAQEANYWASSSHWNATVRSAVAPDMSPIDKVHLHLDEALPRGARLLRDAEGRPAFAGLARVFQEGGEALPHVDRLEWDAPAGRFAFTPVCQYAANVYLHMPPWGGELEIWRQKPTQTQYEELRLAGSYGLDRARLGEAAIVIRPRPGDLIIFDAQNVHAVRASHSGARVTVSMFILRAENGEAFIYS